MPQDAEEILSKDIADAFAQMHMKERYNEILFIADTCQAASLFAEVPLAPRSAALAMVTRVGETLII